MHTWFETKIRYEKTGDDGLPQKVTEPYLVDALSFTEAEARIIEEIRPFVKGDFQVAAIKRARIAELFENPAGDLWYRCKVNFITLDEEKGKEKKTGVTMMVQASTLEDARKYLTEQMEKTLSSYVIDTISETKIVDVYPYAGETPKSPEGDLKSVTEG
jgi:hypothetical protein